MLFRINDFDRTFAMLDELNRRQPARASGRGWADLHVSEDELLLTADLPGVREEDLEITLHQDVLTLSAKRAVEVPEGQRVILRERRPFEVTRRFDLPAPVDPERVTAKLRDGVLTVVLAKADSARPRTIAVTAAA